MAQRDEFNETVKRTLSARVGGLCSNPACRALTSGPHEDAGKAVNLGVATHITAAAPGGPRYDSTLTAEQRSSVENAIWLCQNCAKLIDNDPDRFPVNLLREWKTKAEEEARSVVGKTASRTGDGRSTTIVNIHDSTIGGLGVGTGVNVTGSIHAGHARSPPATFSLNPSAPAASPSISTHVLRDVNARSSDGYLAVKISLFNMIGFAQAVAIPTIVDPLLEQHARYSLPPHYPMGYSVLAVAVLVFLATLSSMHLEPSKTRKCLWHFAIFGVAASSVQWNFRPECPNANVIIWSILYAGTSAAICRLHYWPPSVEDFHSSGMSLKRRIKQTLIAHKEWQRATMFFVVLYGALFVFWNCALWFWFVPAVSKSPSDQMLLGRANSAEICAFTTYVVFGLIWEARSYGRVMLRMTERVRSGHDTAFGGEAEPRRAGSTVS